MNLKECIVNRSGSHIRKFRFEKLSGTQGGKGEISELGSDPEKQYIYTIYSELYKVSIHSGFTSQKCPVIQIIFKYYTYLTECTGAAASTLPLILSTSISDVCAKSFGKPWYSSMMGSNTSANTS